MCNSSAPNPPDPTTIANATTKSNEDTAAFQTGLNAVNQVGPNGSLTYTSTPGKNGAPPQYTATTSYSPAVQKIMNALQQGQQSIATAGAGQAAALPGNLTSVNAPSYSQFGAAPTLNTAGGTAGPIQTSLGGSGNISADTQKYENTLFGQLDTQSGKDQATLESQLAQEGIARGSDAYTRAMDDFTKSKSANRTNAILNAGNFGQQEQNMALNAGNFANSAQAQKFSQTLQNAGFSNQAIQQMFGNNNTVTGANNALKTQGLQDSVTANNQNINQTLALENGSPVQQPSFGSTPQTGVSPTDVAGIAQNGYNQQMSAYNSNQQQLGGIYGTLGTLASTIAPYLLSDKRMKENIRPIGKTNDGQKIYEFNYKGSPTTTIGLMAQEVMKKHPSAVAKIGGLYGVNYKEALRAA